MPPRIVNPALLMPDLIAIGSMTPRDLDRAGQDFLDTMDQIPDSDDREDWDDFAPDGWGS